MSYDPDPGRRRRRKTRKGRVPPQLRAWVFGRRRRKADPGRRRTYGRIGRKPYYRGPRGGVSWVGPKKLRYDPGRRFGRVRRYGSRIEGWINKHGSWLGALLGLVAGVWQGYDNMKKFAPQNPWGRYLGVLKNEWKMLFTKQGDWNPLNYLVYKFTGYNPYGQWESSAWVAPFWLSTLIYIVTKYIPLPIPARIRTPLNKVAQGTMITSALGALFLPGSNGISNGTVAVGQPLVKETWA